MLYELAVFGVIYFACFVFGLNKSIKKLRRSSRKRGKLQTKLKACKAWVFRAKPLQTIIDIDMVCCGGLDIDMSMGRVG